MFKQEGTVGMANLSDFSLYQAGVKLADGVEDGKYILFELDSPFTIADGASRPFEILASISTATTPTNTIDLELYRSVDLYATGGTYGFGLPVTDSASG